MIGRGNSCREWRQNWPNEKGDEDIRITKNRACVERLLEGESDDTLDELNNANTSIDRFDRSAFLIVAKPTAVNAASTAKLASSE